MISDDHFYHIECFLCHKKVNEKENTTVCRSCGGPLDVVYDYSKLKDGMNFYVMQNTPPKTIKYLDFYPIIDRNNLSSLGEGGTQLHNLPKLGSKLGLSRLYLKNEGLNPTGAFKDRGSFVEINKAKELGFKSVCVASTGNMAASVAAYSAQAGLECYVFVPENTPRGKLAQAISYGARVIQVRGTYSDAFNLTVKVAAEFGYYLAGDYAFRGEGQKSLAFEICEQMWFGKIDWVIVPVGMGTNLSYIWKGFKEYFEFGLISQLPKMVAVQAEGASTIVTAFRTHSEIKPLDKPQTICSAIACGMPIDYPKVLKALKESHGTAIAVSDDETLSAQQTLAKMEALYIEPSSATSIVALQRLVKQKIIKENDVVVCVATGAGLKDPATTLKVLADPPTIEPTLSEALKVIKSGILSLRAGGVGDKEKVLFTRVPGEIELKKVIKHEFRLELDIESLKIIKKVISKFITVKGKNIVKADLQSIIETIMQDERRKKTLDVLDFRIETSKRNKPRAYVKISLDGHEFENESEGVGPVDAAINAISSIIKRKNGGEFRLTDFNVEIPTTGSDATVEASMVLQHENGTQVIEKGTSPDIIVASIEAFEKGYNELAYQLKEQSKNSAKKS
ncbi:MAG: threonine synthase [Patescibacteria group bacterium]|nr:threonine synthase [Patescibacteria group bacterium]